MLDDTPETAIGEGRIIPYRRAADVKVAAGRGDAENRSYLKTHGGQVFSFGDQELFLWNSLDGRSSFAAVQRAFKAEFGLSISWEGLSEFIADGVRNGVIERSGDAEDTFELASSEQSAKRIRLPSGYRPDQLKEGIKDWEKLGRQPWTIIVGDPTKFFAVLGIILGPLRHLRWLPIPLAFVACMIIIKNWETYQLDYFRLLRSVRIWPLMYSYEHLLNIVARIIEGTIIQAQGGVVRYYGLRFFMGVMLRAFIDDHSAVELGAKVRIWSKGGVLLVRLALFGLGMIAWIHLRPTHFSLALALLFCGQISLLTFIMNMCPLLMGEGYEVMITYLNQPKLMGRALSVVKLLLSGRNFPKDLSTTERIALLFYAVGTILFTGMICLRIMFDMGRFMLGNAQALGYLIMAVAWGAFVLYFIVLIRYHQKLRATVKTVGRTYQQGKKAKGAKPEIAGGTTD